jgi:hypothetical protein
VWVGSSDTSCHRKIPRHTIFADAKFIIRTTDVHHFSALQKSVIL